MTSATGPGIPGFEIVKVLDNPHNTVFRARDSASGDDVVIKLLDRAKEPMLPKRFDRTRRTLVRLSGLDLGFVPLIDHGVAPAGREYIVVPFYAIGSLQDQVDQGPMPWALAAQLMADVAQIVGQAHAESVVLGDIRPSTILLRAVGDPMVAAIGMATRRFDDGTPDFTSPEAGDTRNRLTAASDVYSLALVFAALVAGEAKQRGRSDEDYLEQVRPMMPSRFFDVIEHGLAPSPTNRYRNATTMERAIRSAIDADPDESVPPAAVDEKEPFDLDEILLDLDEPSPDPVAPSSADSLPPGLEDIVFAPRDQTASPLEEHDLLPPGLEDLILVPRGLDPHDRSETAAEVDELDADQDLEPVLSLAGDAERDGGLRADDDLQHDIEQADHNHTTTVGDGPAIALVDSDQSDATSVLDLDSLHEVDGESTILEPDHLDEPGRRPPLAETADDLPRHHSHRPNDDPVVAKRDTGGERAGSVALDRPSIVVDLDELGPAEHRAGPLSDPDPETTNETADETGDTAYDRANDTAIETHDEAQSDPASETPNETTNGTANDTSGITSHTAGDTLAPSPPILPTTRPTGRQPSVVFADDQTDVFGDGDGRSDDDLDHQEWTHYPARGRDSSPVGAAALVAGVDPSGPTFIADSIADHDIPFTGVTRNRHSAEPLTWLDKTRVAVEVAWFRSRRSMASLAAVLGLLAIAGIAMYFVAREISSTETEAEGVPQNPTTETSSPNYVPTDAPFVTDPPLTHTTTTIATSAPPRRRATTPATARSTTARATTARSTTARQTAPDPGSPTTAQPPAGSGSTVEVLPPTNPPSTANPPPTTKPPATTSPPQTAPPPGDGGDRAANGADGDLAAAVQGVQAAMVEAPNIVTFDVVAVARRSASIRYTSDQCVATQFVLSGGDGSIQRGSSAGFDAENHCSRVWNLDFTGSWALEPATTYTLDVVVKGRSSGLTDRSRVTFATTA